MLPLEMHRKPHKKGMVNLWFMRAIEVSNGKDTVYKSNHYLLSFLLRYSCHITLNIGAHTNFFLKDTREG